MPDLEKNSAAEKCPEVVPEEQTGMTEEEQEWALKKEPRPPVPRGVFLAIALVVILAFAGGSWWYYHKNVLPEKLYQKATYLFEQQRYSAACPIYVHVLEMKPKRRGVIYQIGYCLEMMGEFRAAEDRYKEHLKKLPTDAHAMLRLGWLESRRGDYAEGLPLLQKAAKKLKDPLAWALVSEQGKKARRSDVVIGALSEQIELFKEPAEVYTCSRELMKMGALEQALSGFQRYVKLASGDVRGVHAVNSVKTMLGYPTNPALVIVPEKSVGPVALDMSKDEVKTALGCGPDAKEFTKVGGKSMLADTNTEIWTYNKSMPGKGLRIIFIGGKVREIEGRSPKYLTENGLGLANFLLPKNADKLESRREARNSAILCLVKDGGLTFYAAYLNADGTDAKYKKFRVHKGDSSIDNVDGFSLLNLLDL